MDDYKISLIGEYSSFNTITRDKLIQKLEKIYSTLIKMKKKEVVKNRDLQNNLALFIKKDEIFITVGGNTLSPYMLKVDDTINTKDNGFETEFSAKRDGYLVVIDGMLSIFDPYIISNNRVHTYFIFYPIIYGNESLHIYFFGKRAIPSKDSETRTFSKENIYKIIDSRTLENITLSKGIEPINGSPDILKIYKHIDTTPPVKENGTIDYHNYRAFLEVEDGEILAEKRVGVEAIPGVDAFGKVIHVTAVKKSNFNAGENVIEDRPKNNLIIYKAAITGILELTKTSVSINNLLHIKGDVGAETGNLFYSKNIIVDGDVEALFKIECGGSLTINGSVENGAIIYCKGDMSIVRGIIGEKTTLIVNGNVETNFIQDAKLRVLGNLTVQSYIYNSHVFCGNILRVIGEKVKSNKKGAIVGSDVICMKQMIIHSAGSDYSRTILSCGLDLEL